MLRVPTTLGTSAIPGAGLGLFATAPIARGTILWAFDPGLDQIVDALPEAPLLRRFVEIYAYIPHDEPLRWVLCMDDARFMNHADQPNTSDDDEYTVAARDIAAGEEITCDYRSFCREPFRGFAPAAAP